MLIDIYTIFFFIIGAFLGSFYNVIAMRSLDGRNWISGRSECDSCKHPLGFLDLIPIFSYLIFKGKCRYCKEKIPPQHFLSEIGFGLLLALIKPNFILFILLSVLWINLISDLTEKTTITLIIYAGMLIIFVSRIINEGFNYKLGLALLMFIIVFLMNMIFNEKDNSFGLGDIDILLLITFYNNIYGAFEALLLGSIAGTIILIPWFITKKLTFKSQIPLVPFIFLGFIISHMGVSLF